MTNLVMLLPGPTVAKGGSSPTGRQTFPESSPSLGLYEGRPQGIELFYFAFVCLLATLAKQAFSQATINSRRRSTIVERA